MDNNHGTLATMQIAGIAGYLGQIDLAKSTLESQKQSIADSSTANGSQPLELARELEVGIIQPWTWLRRPV